MYCVLFIVYESTPCDILFWSCLSSVHLYILQGGVTELIICELPSAHRWSDPKKRYGYYC